MERLIEQLPPAVRDLVVDRAQARGESHGAAIGGIIDDVLADGWTYDKEHDAFRKAGDMVMAKVVWRALMEERGAG